MANHVYSHLAFDSINDQAKQALDQLVQTMIERASDKQPSLAAGKLDDISDVTYDWMYDNVGAKWAYLDDYYDHAMSFESAWHPPVVFINWLIEHLSQYDKHLVAKYNYSDEGYSFLGVIKYTSNGSIDGVEIDYEQLVEEMLADDSISELREQWDSTDGDWLDGGSLFHDLVHEYVSDWQHFTYLDLSDE